MSEPLILEYEDKNYYSSDYVMSNFDLYVKGSRTANELIKHKKILKQDYIVFKHNVKKDEWELATTNSKKFNKVFFLESKYEEIEKANNDMMEKLKKDLERTPPIIELEDHEKFTDNQGNVLDIVTRGNRNHNEIFFCADSVEKLFGIKNLKNNIIQEKSSYKEYRDYVFFNCSISYNVLNEKIKDIGKNVYLTYEGMLRFLFVSTNDKSSRFLSWASATLFTVQIGTKTQKRKLAANLINVSNNVLRSCLNTNVKSVPCLYLFSLGKVKDLRKSMNLGPEYKDEDIVYKYGLTKSLATRSYQHNRKYGQLEGCEVNLVYHAYIDPINLQEAENDFRNVMKEKNKHIVFESNKELIILSDEEKTSARELMLSISDKYMGHVTELLLTIKDMKQQLLNQQDKYENTITNIHKDYKIKLLEKDNENKEKINDMEKKISCMEKKISCIENERQTERYEHKIEILNMTVICNDLKNENMSLKRENEKMRKKLEKQSGNC